MSGRTSAQEPASNASEPLRRNDRQVIDGSGRTVDVYDSLQEAARSAFDYGNSCQENTIHTTGDEEIVYMADSDE